MAAKTIKISDEALAAIGATESDFEAKVLALIKERDGFKADAGELAKFTADVTAKFAALEAKLTALEGRKPEVAAEDRTKIIDLAKEAAKATASSEVAAIIAKAGVAAVAGGGKEGNGGGGAEKPKFSDLVAAKVAKGKTKADAIVECIAENPEAYAAWRAEAGVPDHKTAGKQTEVGI